MCLLDLPTYSLDDFFDEMLERRHDNEKNNYLITRLSLIKEHLIEDEDKYISLAREGALHTYQKQHKIKVPLDTDKNSHIIDNVTAKEMGKVYKNFFVNHEGSNNIGREIYHKIMNNTYDNICPYCSVRHIKTLDHYLPQAFFISLVVTPANLLPSCTDCNKDKLDDNQLTKTKMLIHPYFENIHKENWLTCEVVKDSWPITFSYRVANNVSNEILRSRLQYHFHILDLSELYATSARNEFNNRVKSIINIYHTTQNKQDVIDFIDDNIDTYSSVNVNAWQAKMFEALKESGWFMDEALPLLGSYYKR